MAPGARLIVPFYSEAVGWTVEIDGVTYRPALIDSDGHAQIDIVSSALPSGAASAAKQDTMVTALQLIDDLRNALRSVATDELVVTLDVKGDDIRWVGAEYSTPQTATDLIAAPGAGKKIHVTGIFFSTDTAGAFQLYGASVPVSGVFGYHYFPDNGGISAPTLSAPIVLTADCALRFNSDITGNHTISVAAKVV